MFKYNFILCFLLSTLSYTAFSSSEEPPERFAALKSASCSEFEKTLKELDEPSAPVIPAINNGSFICRRQLNKLFQKDQR